MNLLIEFLASESSDPEKIVIESKSEKRTNRELRDRVFAIADFLKKNGAKKNGRVVICLPKRIDSVEFILATMVVGATYVPVDYTAPLSRIENIINDADADVVVAVDEVSSQLLDSNKISAKLIEINSDSGAIEHLLDFTVKKEIEEINPNDIAAILYTSGSTGNPKGVMLSHRNIYRFSSWVINKYDINSCDRFISHAPFHFDLSTMDLYSALLAGAYVYIFDEVEKRFPSTLTKVVESKKITVWYSVPSALMLIEEKGALDKRDLSSLRLVFFAGEVYPVPELTKLMVKLPYPRYINLYGPTETNVCTYYELINSPELGQVSIPIGKPCEHYQLLIVDENDIPVPIGSKGEIVIIGDGVMKGYWGCPDKTAGTRYKNNPQSYRTGDFGMMDALGEVWYGGRIDGQVKIQGYRVELSEIEGAANLLPEVKESAAVVLDEDNIKTIHLAVVLHSGMSLTEEQILMACAEKLAIYAVPKCVYFFDAFTRTSTDKIDRQWIKKTVENASNKILAVN